MEQKLVKGIQRKMPPSGSNIVICEQESETIGNVAIKQGNNSPNVGELVLRARLLSHLAINETLIMYKSGLLAVN